MIKKRRSTVLYKEHVLKEITLFNQKTVNPEELAEFHADDGLIVDPTTQKLYRGKSGAEEWFTQTAKTLGLFSAEVIHLEEITQNAVYYHMLMTLLSPDGGKLYILVRCTSIGIEVDGGWKIKHEQWDQHPCDAQGNVVVL
jgi:ketosteroid isomerase-like protein